jgi:hypothetical protein
MNDEPLKPLDYADPNVESARPPGQRKETVELFREPPAIAEASRTDVIIWVVSFVVVLAAFVWLIGYWFGAAWTD